MTDTFNEQFLSVFTVEDTTNIPLTEIPVPENVYTGDENDRLMGVDITVEAVKTRLAALREDKSPGPDDFSPKLLKMISEEIAYLVSLLLTGQ